MADRQEQRAAERFAVNTFTSCDFVSPVLEDFDPARLQNISVDGIGMISSQELHAGLLLVVNLVNSAQKFSKTLMVRVVHCTQQAGGNFLVGGTFLKPLTYEELKILVM